MKHNYSGIDKILLLLVLAFLFVPLVQSSLKIKKEIKPLQGAFNEFPDTCFNWPGWFSREYQEKKEDFFGQHFGFRNYYVRLNNQFDFTLFGKINSEGVVPGKAGIYFLENYIQAYLGKNFVGKEQLRSLAQTLKNAQEILRSKNIDLEIVFAPSKTNFYPEFIPDSCGLKTRRSNYDFMVAYCKEIGLDFIDCNAWFKKMKNKEVYDLYTAGGIHWSNYGSLLAYDSLLRHIESKAPMVLRRFKINRIDYSNEILDPDKDIVELCNLLRTPELSPVPHAEYSWVSQLSETRPKMLFVGDSYFWNWYYQGLVSNTCSDGRFWYYNKTVYTPDAAPTDVSALSFKEEVEKNNVVVLMATEVNIHDIGWGFASRIVENFKLSSDTMQYDAPMRKNLEVRKKIYIQYFIGEMMKTPEWLEKIKVKAGEKNISVDQMMRMDAEYLYDTEYSSPEVIAYTEMTKQRIEKDSKWMRDVRAKAAEKNISVSEMLELDAKYLYETEGKVKK